MRRPLRSAGFQVTSGWPLSSCWQLNKKGELSLKRQFQGAISQLKMVNWSFLLQGTRYKLALAILCRRIRPYMACLSDRMSSDVESTSLGDLNKIRNVTDLLKDMVYALNPSDRTAINDEIITDLVTQCRSNQEKLLQFVSSSGNEQLLKQGLEINDLLQSVLSKYDAMASGAPLAVEAPVREAIEATREAPAQYVDASCFMYLQEKNH